MGTACSYANIGVKARYIRIRRLEQVKSPTAGCVTIISVSYINNGLLSDVSLYHHNS